METVSPSSLIERDRPVAPNGMVRGIAEVVRNMAKPVKIEVKRTMFGVGRLGKI
jgi:hypothetical protein